MRALIVYRGMLCVVEVSPNPDGQCVCGAKEFIFEEYGWMVCECGFKILKTDWEKITMEELYPRKINHYAYSVDDDDDDDDDFDEILSFDKASELTEIKEDLKKILARLDEILER